MRIKSYISWSQFEAINAGKENYKKIYIDGIRRENKYMDFGKKISDGLQFRAKKTTDKDILMARKLIPKPQHSEKELKVVWGGIPLLSRLDGLSLDTTSIEEYKTGKGKWTQAMADKFEQITFYTAVVSRFFEGPPEQIISYLRWLETYEDTDGTIHLTGFVKVFKTTRTQIDLIRFYPKLKKAWEEIEEVINENL